MAVQKTLLFFFAFYFCSLFSEKCVAETVFETSCDSSLLQVKMKRSTSSVILNRMSYICSFNSDTRCANWSAWYLPKEHADGPYVKKDLRKDPQLRRTYMEDEATLVGRQLLSDWNNTEGYDHGHLCPSADNKWDLEAMKQTYFLSNMCVQNSSLNQGPWERLESSCRMWAKKFGGIYIIAGPIYSNNKINRTSSGIAIPDSFFKVVLCLDEAPKAIGFVYENKAATKGTQLEQHVATIDEIEKITGFDFFASLPDSLEKTVEASLDIQLWKIK